MQESFCVDDCLSRANSVEETIQLQRQLHNLFHKGEFLLHKWNSNVPIVLKHVPNKYKDPLSLQVIPNSEGYTRTLGIEWNAKLDQFRLKVFELPGLKEVTKRFLVSDIYCQGLQCTWLVFTLYYQGKDSPPESV